ncbi:MAG: hypothetical protein AABY86_12790 [Bdellovibrionota bacterium]
MEKIYVMMLVVFLPTLVVAQNDPLYGYRWMSGAPQVLPASQVFSSESHQLCGNIDYEICIGPANNPDRPSDPVRMVKCLIPKNSTSCPATINAEARCSLANESTSSSAILACDRRHPERDNTPQGCHCGELVSRGSRIIKRNLAGCLALLDSRRESQRRQQEDSRLNEVRCRLLSRSVWLPHAQICLSRCGAPDANGICTCTVSTGGNRFGEQFGSSRCP